MQLDIEKFVLSHLSLTMKPIKQDDASLEEKIAGKDRQEKKSTVQSVVANTYERELATPALHFVYEHSGKITIFPSKGYDIVFGLDNTYPAKYLFSDLQSRAASANGGQWCSFAIGNRRYDVVTMDKDVPKQLRSVSRPLRVLLEDYAAHRLEHEQSLAPKKTSFFTPVLDYVAHFFNRKNGKTNGQVNGASPRVERPKIMDTSGQQPRRTTFNWGQQSEYVKGLSATWYKKKVNHNND